MYAPKYTTVKQLEDGAPHQVPALKAVHFDVFAVATFLAFAHTVDEVRVGELIALPFAVANVAVAVVWPRLGRRWQLASSLGFGLFWGLAVVPYHVVPLLAGLVTWQNISGLTRLIAGFLMVALGVAMMLQHRGARTHAVGG
jgi:hypothetical protein